MVPAPPTWSSSIRTRRPLFTCHKPWTAWISRGNSGGSCKLSWIPCVFVAAAVFWTLMSVHLGLYIYIYIRWTNDVNWKYKNEKQTRIKTYHLTRGKQVTTLKNGRFASQLVFFEENSLGVGTNKNIRWNRFHPAVGGWIGSMVGK